MGKPGRKTMLTDEVRAALIDAARAGATVEIAADYAGVNAATVYRWLALGERRQGVYREFREAWKRARGKRKLESLVAIRAAAKESWQAAAWYLERTEPRHFAQHVNVRVAEEINGFLDVIRQRLTPAQYRLVLEAYASENGGGEAGGDASEEDEASAAH